jgi:hypothetical protein
MRNEFVLKVNQYYNATEPGMVFLTPTGSTCMTGCITGLGGEDMTYTCVGV